MIKVFIPLIFTASLAHASSYCLAIRGNGELMPAHWGAISKVVQKKGYPHALAGGSSASITMFLIESLAINPRTLSNTEKSLLVKSFQGYLEALTQTEEGKAIASILGDKELIAKLKKIADQLDEFKLDPETMKLFKKTLASLQVVTNSADLKDIINPEFIEYLKETLTLVNQGQAKFNAILSFRKTEITKAIKEFGKFNAVTDDTLFFRPGLLNFKSLAKIFGQMGDFYAGVKLSDASLQENVDQDLNKFLASCAAGSEDLTWQQINQSKPYCRKLFGKAVLTRRAAAQASNQVPVRIYENVSSHLLTLPTTSVLLGNAVESYKAAKEQYGLNSDPAFGSQFKIKQRELRFGYWGKEETLKRIGSFLKTNELTKDDEKSKKFISLGDASWMDVISTSPAEPGLSNFIELSKNRISAGGWSDLHPTLVLKASGCQDIVYVTRKGGESMFSQDVIERLTSIDGFSWKEWQNLTPAQKVQKRARGDSRDVGPYASLWSKLYNMANPDSSINVSMKAATTTVCTDWDRFNVKKQMNELIEQSFKAPWLNEADPICNF
ncbi:MAG: hypothetical protein KC478_01450 [Bacteriovoracaceae bacterium]|nr:hypothetical protein [Bacteriovoracaceae bacterium]